MSNDNKQELEQLRAEFSKANKSFLNEVNAVATTIKEGLLDNKNSSAKRLPERVFVEHFLPHFAGKPELEGKPWIRDWVAIAGSAMAEVVIVDNSNKELYAVPPIMDTSFINVGTKDIFSPTLHSAVAHSLRIAANTPSQGEHYLNGKLVEKIDAIVDPKLSERSENEKRWVEIFDRYGIKTKEEPAAEQKTAVDDSMGSMLDYD